MKAIALLLAVVSLSASAVDQKDCKFIGNLGSTIQAQRQRGFTADQLQEVVAASPGKADVDLGIKSALSLLIPDVYRRPADWTPARIEVAMYTDCMATVKP